MNEPLWISNHTFIYKGRIADLSDPRPFGHDVQEIGIACQKIDDELYEEFKQNMMRFRKEEEQMQETICKLDDYDKLIKQWAKEGKIK